MDRINGISDSWNDNPLIRGISQIAGRVAAFKDEARRFYYAVLLSAHSCPTCGGTLRTIGPSKCKCRCGAEWDPTVEFQKSNCCEASLQRKVLHYACSSCGKTIPSKFLFDERLFDNAYFAHCMRQSRERKRARRNEIQEMLSLSRSGVLQLTEAPDIESITGLAADLDSFVAAMPEMPLSAFSCRSSFLMAEYRRAILEDVPAGCLIRFSGMRPLCENARLDRIRRFVTLIFMEQAQEVGLTERGDEIMVEVYETDEQGC